MGIFYNRDIFSADRDYIIAGFEVQEGQFIDFPLIYNKMTDRIMNLVTDYINASISINAKLGYEDPVAESHAQASQVIYDYLQVNPDTNDVLTLVKTILDSEKMQTWTTNLKENIQDYQKNLSNAATSLSIPSKFFGSPTESSYNNAVVFTKETTFEQLVEEIASIQM